MKDDVVQILTTIILSGAFFSFIQFLITFLFSRRDKLKEVEKKLDMTNSKIDRNQAVLARTHILRFADDIRNGINHSDEYFRQQMLDCDTYDTYCREHPDFSNGLTIIASETIRSEYRKLFMKGGNQGETAR